MTAPHRTRTDTGEPPPVPRPARHGGAERDGSSGRSRGRGIPKWLARLAVIAVAALAVVFVNPGAAQADDGCSDLEWHQVLDKCLDTLPDEPKGVCKEAPVAGAPDSGMAGWFAEEPDWYKDDDFQKGKYVVPKGQYTVYGYAGYELPTYDIGCAGSAVPDGDTAGNSLASLEFTFATGITGASNGLREAAWQPEGMWGWADNLVDKASHAIFEKVFSPFGAITVGLVGLYLIWRSRQADMSMAITTAGWAVLVMVVVTAIARWPVESANFADEGLTSSLSVVQDAVGPPAEEACTGNCDDVRPAAMRASDMVTGEILYRNWVRSVLGQSEEVVYKKDGNGDVVTDADGNPVVESGNTAYKYGPALYDATAFSWQEIQESRSDPSNHQKIVEAKAQQFRNVAKAIQEEDPEAYQQLTGADGWDRAGTGFLAVLSALFFALFDITASVLIILGFLLIRWAVIALPLIGTVAILRPASGGFKRLISAVLAAIINVIVFGVAAAVYLFAVAQVLSASIPGWLQVLLIALMGVAAWMLLRPYRRIGSLSGGRSISDSLMGRRHVRVEVETRTKGKRSRSEGEAVIDEPPDAQGDADRESIMAAARRSKAERAETAGNAGSKTLPPRPTPGGASASSGGRSRPGYSVYRPSGSGTGARSGDKPLVAVRPD